MERCFISGHSALMYLLLVAVVICPPCCHASDESADMQLSATPQATPTPFWAVDWGPTDDDMHHFLPSPEAEGVKHSTPKVWSGHRNPQANQTQLHSLSIEAKDSEEEPERDAEEREVEEVMTAASLSVPLLSPLPSLVLWPKTTAGTHFKAHPRSLTEKDFPWSIFEELTVSGLLITSYGHEM